MLLVVALVALPYALVTVGVFMLTGEMGWALITLGGLILATVLVALVVASLR
jgi:hypothetical protein